MNQKRFILAIYFIFIFVFSACTAVPQSTPSPEIAAEIVTVPPKRPSATPTAQSISTPVETSTATVSPMPTKFTVPFVPTRTETPIRPTATNTPAPTQAPFAWNTGIKEIIRAERVIDFVWSPTSNEFASYGECDTGEAKVYFTSMLQPEKVEITPAGLICNVYILWHPSGEFFFFSGESSEEWRKIEGWKVDAKNLTLSYLENQSYYWGWLNDEIQITEKWAESDMYYINLYNTITEENVSSAFFGGSVMDVSKNHVVLNESFAGTHGSSAAIFSQYEISPDIPLRLGDRNVKLLGRTQEIVGVRWGYIFFSKAIDVLPSSDKILVLTWGKEIPEPFLPQEVLVGAFPVNLQLWDADMGELVLVKEGGIYGRFSPSGNELVTLSALPDSPQLELTNRLTNEIIITQPAYAESAEHTVDVYAYTSFSPNGRFLTYYSPEQELIIYDIAFGTFLPSVTAVPMTPVWSPDSSRFVYQDSELGLSIYEIEPHTTYSLTQDGCDQLRNPQWSFDGSYLSVSEPCAGTAVLQLP